MKYASYSKLQSPSQSCPDIADARPPPIDALHEDIEDDRSMCEKPVAMLSDFDIWTWPGTASRSWLACCEQKLAEGSDPAGRGNEK